MPPEIPEAEPKVIKFISGRAKKSHKNHFQNKVKYFFLISMKIH